MSVDPNERVELTLSIRPRRPLEEPRPGEPPLSREAFAERYGADPADLERCIEFARSRGLQVLESDAARRVVRVAGPASAVSAAFGVQLQRIATPEGRSYRAPTSEVSVPEDLKDVVQGVFGLDERPIARHA